KNNITPVRREFLSGLRAFIALDGNLNLEERVRRGLRGEFNQTRYGVPFLGDNQFLLDRLEERPSPEKAFWYERLEEATAFGPLTGTVRFTVWIDRGDMSQTQSGLFAPTAEPSTQIPEKAWTEINPPADEPVLISKTKRKKT